MIPIAQLAVKYNVPIIGYESIASELLENRATTYATLSRVSQYGSQMGGRVVLVIAIRHICVHAAESALHLCKHFGWTQVAVIVDTSVYNLMFNDNFKDPVMRKRYALEKPWVYSNVGCPLFYRTGTELLTVRFQHTILETEFDDHSMDVLMAHIRQTARSRPIVTIELRCKFQLQF